MKIDGPAGMDGGTVPVYGFCSWFDVLFTGKDGLAGNTVTLSTAPAVDKPVAGMDDTQREGSTQTPTGLADVNPVTHWKQVRPKPAVCDTALVPVPVPAGDDE